MALSAPGRFLRHVAGLFGEKLTADRLLTLLKHPRTASTGDRGRHLLFTRHLELKLRKHGPSFPTGDDLMAWAQTRSDAGILDWARFLAQALEGLGSVGTSALTDHVTQHRALAETLARGTADTGSGALWDKEAGLAALALMTDLATEAPYGGTFSAPAYRDLFNALMNKRCV